MAVGYLSELIKRLNVHLHGELRGELMRNFVLGVAALVAVFAGQSQAALVWSIDSNVSYIRLNIPDQPVPIDEENTLNAKLRDYQVNGGPMLDSDPDVPTSWTDLNGRRSFVSGTISSNYVEGSSIQFVPGTHSAGAIEYGLFLPDPSAVPGPAAFAADVWNTFEADPDNFPGELTYLRLGHVRIRNINYDLDGTASLAAGPPTTWTQSGGSINLGTLAGSVVDVDLLGILTDYGVTLDPFGAANQGSLMVEDLGANQRRLTIDVDVPISLDINGILLTASISGQIVGLATVPEPASVSLVGLALSLCALRRRRTIV